VQAPVSIRGWKLPLQTNQSRECQGKVESSAFQQSRKFRF
jgi:hypothetical protein